MINEILIYNRFAMDLVAKGFQKEGMGNNSIVKGKPWYLISIYGCKNEPLVQEKLGCRDILSLQFDDITQRDYNEFESAYPEAVKKYILFGKEHAEKILDFLDKINTDEENCALVVHCHAGISRSGAVAVFAAKKYGIVFYDPYIKPNGWVLFNLNLYEKYNEQRKETNEKH